MTADLRAAVACMSGRLAIGKQSTAVYGAFRKTGHFREHVQTRGKRRRIENRALLLSPVADLHRLGFLPAAIFVYHSKV
jgi:hypothetical protein